MQGLDGKVREHEASLVDSLAVILVLLQLLFGADGPQGRLDVPALIFAADHEANLTTWVGGDGSVSVLDDWEHLFADFLEGLDEFSVEPDALSWRLCELMISMGCKSRLLTLRCYHPPFSERFIQELEIGFLEKNLRWSLWVTAVCNNAVELVLVVFQILEAVHDQSLGLWAVESHCHVREELLGNAGHGFINIDQRGSLNRRMLDDLAQHTTVAATDDQNVFWVRV